MASFELREPKKKPRYYKLIANVLVNGKIERRYGRFDFDPTELKNARARNAAAKAAAAEFERLEQEKADKEASNAGKTFAVVAQEYIASNRSRMAPSVRLKGDYDSNRNKENTSLKKEKYLQRIQCYPEFSEKPIALITKKDCDAMIRFIEDSDARVYKRAVLKSEAKGFKTVSCPKIAKKCTIREETIERIFRGETVSLDSAQQVATALGKTVEQMFEVEIDRRPMTKKTMREYNLFIRSVLNYANDNYGTSLQMPMIKASGRKGKSVDCLHSDEVEALQAALKECSMLEKAIILCLLNTGVRRGELAGLTWKDVNFREGTIHVSKSLLVFQNYGYQLTTTKESNIRDVDVAPEFMAFLKDYHEVRTVASGFARERLCNLQRLRFPHQPGQLCSTGTPCWKKGRYRENPSAYVPAHLREHPAVQSQYRCGNGGRRSRTRTAQYDPCNLHAGLRQTT